MWNHHQQTRKVLEAVRMAVVVRQECVAAIPLLIMSLNFLLRVALRVLKTVE